MTYSLGVDLGTTYTAAAVDAGAGAVPLRLGSAGEAMPSVVALSDGQPVTGEAAEEVLRSNPAAGVREAKRRLGDSTPMVLAGTPYGAEAILGLLLADVVKVATEQQGAPPSSVVLAHPANWGGYKKDLLSDTARIAGLDDVGLITEPQAAALAYVRAGELGVGQTAAVYDFGGGTFDAAVVRAADGGPELLGEATGLERLGGIDLDQAILMHVNEATGGALRELDASDPAAGAAMAALRARCVAAKEDLSTAGEVTIPVSIPRLDTEVRLTRAELEEVLRPRVADTLKQLDAALASAGVAAGDLSAVLLVGGTSRIPLVSEMVAAHTGARVVASADHKSVVCVGAAAGDSPVGAGAAAAAGADAGGAGAAGAFVVTGPGQVDPALYRGGVNKRRLALLGGAGVVAAAGAAVAAATAAGIISPGDMIDSLSASVTGALDGGGDGQGGENGGMAADEMDEFDLLAPLDIAQETIAGAAAGFAALGETPLARAAAVSSYGGSSYSPGYSSPGYSSGGGSSSGYSSGGSSSSGNSSNGHSSAGHGATHQTPDAEPGDSPSTPPGADADFLDTKARLMESIRDWEPPEDLDPAEAEAFRQKLLDRMERFQPMPGESTEHALQAMRDEYQDVVDAFATEQQLDEVSEQMDEILEERREQQEAEAAVDTALTEAKDKLLEELSNYEPPEAVDPEAYADMREDIEALIDRYEPIPGQTPDEAIDELIYQYSNRVKDLAQDTKLEGVEEDLTGLAEDEVPDEPGNTGFVPPWWRHLGERTPEDGSEPGWWEQGGEGEPPRMWVDIFGTRHPDRELGPHVVRDPENETMIFYDRAYADRARELPSTPTVTELDDGRFTVTFVNEQGRHVTIATDDAADGIAKYQRYNPPPQQAGNQLAPDVVMVALTAPDYGPGTGIVPDIMIERLGLEPLHLIHEEARAEVFPPEAPTRAEDADADADADDQTDLEYGTREVKPEEAAPDDDVVEDPLGLDAFDELDLETMADTAMSGANGDSEESETEVDLLGDDRAMDDDRAAGDEGLDAGDDAFGDTTGSAQPDELAEEPVDEFATNEDPADEFAMNEPEPADEFDSASTDADDPFDSGSDTSSDSLETTSSGSDTQDDPVLG